MASASGLHLVPRDRRDATRSSSRGTGELIRAALDAGARKIILGLGGSATNDAGAGLLSALGVRFLAADGEELAPGGAALAGLQSRPGRAGSAPGGCRGKSPQTSTTRYARGASAVFGPQGRQRRTGGATGCRPGALRQGGRGDPGRDFSRVPGVAAGGLGFAARAFRARFRPGIELVAELAGLADALVGADLVLTGEGRLDAQSLHGKTPVGVARIARQAGVPVVALAGSLGDGYQRLHDAGIDAAFSLAPGPISLEQACAGAAAELEARAEQIARLWRLAQASREG